MKTLGSKRHQRNSYAAITTLIQLSNDLLPPPHRLHPYHQRPSENLQRGAWSDGQVAEEVGEAVAEGEGFAREVGGSVGVAGGAIVTEVADFEDVGVDAAGFAVPAGSGIVEGHCVNGHAEIIDGESGEGLPFSHQAHLGDALFDQGSVDGIAKCPEKTRPVADLPNPDTAAEEMLEDVIHILDNAPDSTLHFAAHLY